ncbi:MAG: hypothetical protein Q7U68_04720 [Candidatus Roizmanbacteria bacterium]|nr:hypothetical protein [Candidatus Roizmanbacteria bacterium]
MEADEKIREFMDKVKKMEKSEKLDLSSDEDLSIAIMNLISIEEHLFFSGGKTGKTKYYDLLQEVREMRKQLLKLIVKDYEGEVWCISKHLLAASMRLMEVGTKAQGKGEKERAYDLFKKSFDLYNLFWAINLGMIKPEQAVEVEKNKETPIEYLKKDFLGGISKILGKIFNCCRE